MDRTAQQLQILGLTIAALDTTMKHLRCAFECCQGRTQFVGDHAEKNIFGRVRFDQLAGSFAMSVPVSGYTLPILLLQ